MRTLALACLAPALAAADRRTSLTAFAVGDGPTAVGSRAQVVETAPE